ncbi:MAG: YfiR family protein [Gammaproteobacteria bacterium]|nr:YfiR family protein [Gammaproteobacteria bacterium]
MNNTVEFILKWSRLCTLAVLLMNTGVHAEMPSAKEHQIKAVFLYHFTSYVTWPGSAFSGEKSPFYLCILGEASFDSVLDIASEKFSAKESRPLKVKRFKKLLETSHNCHILFISTSERPRLAAIIKHASRQKTLTVSDIKDFICHDGMIRFITENKQVHFAINLKKVKKAGLKISGNMLQLAKYHSSEAENCRP